MEATEFSLSLVKSREATEDVQTSTSKQSIFTESAAPGLPLRQPVAFRVVYSELERGLFDLYLAVSITVSTFLNVLVLVAILKDTRLYKPENVIIAADAINNLLGVIATQPFMVWALSVDYPLPSYVLCQIHGHFTAHHLLFPGYIICVYALERSCFLCRPLEYNKLVTNGRVVVVLLVLYVFLGVVVYFSAPQGRMLLATMACCQSKTATMSTGILFGAIGIPNLLAVVYSVRKIRGLGARSVGGAAVAKQRARQVSTSKTILLVSGAYFVTLVPMGVLRLVVLATGISVLDLEMRNCSHAWPILFRIANLIMGTTVNFMNPILYLTMRKSLKASLGLNSLQRRPTCQLSQVEGSRRISPSEVTNVTNY